MDRLANMFADFIAQWGWTIVAVAGAFAFAAFAIFVSVVRFIWGVWRSIQSTRQEAFDLLDKSTRARFNGRRKSRL